MKQSSSKLSQQTNIQQNRNEGNQYVDETEIISTIYDICADNQVGDNQVGDNQVGDNQGDQRQCIANSLKKTYYGDKLHLPKTVNSKQHSFITLLNHQRNKPCKLSISSIISDGYKVNNQFVGNQYNLGNITRFRDKIIFPDYIQSIPSGKRVTTKHGHIYNIDDLILFILSGNNTEPNDSTCQLFDSEKDENLLIAHPGLSEELRSRYILKKNNRYQKQIALQQYIDNNPDVFNQIGYYGIIFLNFKLIQDDFKTYVTNFVSKIGDIVSSPLLDFELFDTISFKSIITSAMHDKPAPEEFGYYLILLYLTIYSFSPHLPLLNCFKNLSSKCDTDVIIAPIVHNQIVVTDKINLANPSTAALQNIGDYSLFASIPQRFSKQLVLTSYNLHDNQVTHTKSFNKSYYVNLDEYCEGFDNLVNKINYNSIDISREFLNIYLNIHQDLNQ